MNLKNKGAMYLLLALLVSGVAFGGYYAYKNFSVTEGTKDAESVGGMENMETKPETETVESVSEYADVRNKDLSNCTIKSEELLRSLTFNEDTIWPDSSKLPQNIDPKKLLEEAKYPGMGIRKLHEQGITGKDIHVAIIDQDLANSLEHPEYKDAIAEFKSFFPEETIKSEEYKSHVSFHGPAMTGLLAGKNTGVAPGVKLHYLEIPSGKLVSGEYYAKALDYIIEKNKSLSDSEKIRVVSVSAAPSATTGPTMPKGELWEAAFKRARENGVLVIDTLENVMSCSLGKDDVDDISKAVINVETARAMQENEDLFVASYRKIKSVYELLFIPCGPRTSCESQASGRYSYECSPCHGSQSVATLSGIVALGLQVNPNVSNDEIMKILNETAYINQKGFKIVNPEKFVNAMKNIKN